MPIARVIESGSRLVIHTCTGAINKDDIRTAYLEMLDDPDFRPGTDILWNFSSAVVVPPSEEDIFDFTDMVQKSRAKRGSEYKVAMVADKELYYGLLRMYQAYSGPLPIELMVFRSLPEAMHWLKETPRTEQLEDGGT